MFKIKPRILFNYFLNVSSRTVSHTNIIFLLIFLIQGCKPSLNEDGKALSLNETNLYQEEAIYKNVNSKPKVTLIESHYCKQVKLSFQFDLVHYFRKYDSKVGNLDSSISLIYLEDKKSSEHLDSFSCYLIPRESISCDNNVSYSTNYNTSIEYEDGHCGDIIIADFNFDNLDDIAVADQYSARSILYSFYLQNENRKFLRNDYLSDVIRNFPVKISKGDSTLTTWALDTHCSSVETIYKYIDDENKWIEYKSTRTVTCDD